MKAPSRFFVAGVSKAGTTALYGFLRQHPQLFLCPIKEPSYFAATDFLAIEEPPAIRTIRQRAQAVEQWVAGELPHIPSDGFAFEWSSYEALFAGLHNERAVGDCSTTYWYAPRAPAAIAARFPEARIVLMLRNPADRFFSQFLTTRLSSPLVSCRKFFDLALAGREGWGLVLDMGRYATNLKRFLRFFPRHRISVHWYEDFCRDPRSVCRDIFEFLGVDASHSVDLSARVNEPSLPRWPVVQAMRASIAGSCRLSGRLPSVLESGLCHLYYKPRSDESMSVADRRAIIDYYRDEILETSILTGRDLTVWLSCY